MGNPIASPVGEDGAHLLNSGLSRSKIIKRRAVEDATALSRSTIYRGIQDGTFPAPIRLGPRAVGWRADEIAAWVEQRTAERDAGGAK